MLYIQPFESADGGAFDWHGGKASQYRWGELAVRLGKHCDAQDTWRLEREDDSWEEDLDEIEEALLEYASEQLGELVRLAPDYI
jgi:hypothetical protein